MQDQPGPSEILAAVAAFLRGVVAAETGERTSFQVRVCANALEMMRRQIDLAPPAEAAETDRLHTLLGEAARGDLAALNAELSTRIERGEIDLTTPGLADHLWATTLAKLAVDQPNYWGYRAALASPDVPKT